MSEPTLARICVLAAVLAGCGGDPKAAAWQANPAPPPVFPTREDAVRHHMRLHFGDLGTVQQQLLHGDLAEAKSFAFLLTQRDTAPSMAPWDRETTAVADAARAVKDATSINEALHREVRVALACANCHIAAGRVTIFKEPPPVPADSPTVEARMARHAWAASRLWEGVVTPSEDRWMAGLQVLAAAPVSFSNKTDAPSLALALQHRAQFEMDNRAKETLEMRVTAYGDLLVTCAGCHAAITSPPAAAAVRGH